MKTGKALIAALPKIFLILIFFSFISGDGKGAGDDYGGRVRRIVERRQPLPTCVFAVELPLPLSI